MRKDNLIMGKKRNKQIKNSFKGWDEMTPEDQMRNADEFFNIDKKSAEDILGLGVSNKKLVDKDTGLESAIVDDIVKNFGVEDTDSIVDETLVDEFVTNLEDVGIPEEDENVPVNGLETNEEKSYDLEDDRDKAEEETADIEYSQPVTVDVVEKDADYYVDIRKFGCIVRTTIGITTFDDGTAPFAINEHVAMLEGLAKDIDSSSIDDSIIELFKKALIVNRYPAALFTKDEFVNMLGKGKFNQLPRETATFVDVLDSYIAVYFVHGNSIARFSDTIRSIITIDDEEEYGNPYYNVWFYLATLLDSDDHSFINEEGSVEMFYNSSHNDKELVKEYLEDKFIDRTNTDDDVVVSIIGRNNVESKFQYVMDEIIDINEPENDGVVVNNETEKEAPVISDQDDAKAALAKALAENAANNEHPMVDNKKDDSMVIPVHHKEAKV